MTVKADLSEPYWADLKREIASKTSETMGRLLFDHGEGTISDRELRISVDAIYDCIVGIAPRDVTDALYALRGEVSL